MSEFEFISDEKAKALADGGYGEIEVAYQLKRIADIFEKWEVARIRNLK